MDVMADSVARALEIVTVGGVGPYEIWLTVGLERARLGCYDRKGDADTTRCILAAMLRELARNYMP
jgi:hypothetical protein